MVKMFLALAGLLPQVAPKRGNPGWVTDTPAPDYVHTSSDGVTVLETLIPDQSINQAPRETDSSAHLEDVVRGEVVCLCLSRLGKQTPCSIVAQVGNVEEGL